ncbi:sulfurtransferase TusA family protein [Crassaminicella profunda]|uniref:sulfurtransferase TusA family protein n=1 Tax=Crassaminicella profunda TaxID=1286698 RepID=UPI001CA6A4A9|nr:sulfurtransferase TusA family protein [Crassaminicella profunda]QZY55241.1 sulfurtransferase TusA family protein [Crassaminicella profunda]
MAKIDVRGMSCPQPVLMTKNAIASNPSTIEVIVDNNTAKNNVSRFLKNAGYDLSVEELDEDYLISAKK